MTKYDHGYRGVEALREGDGPLPLRRVELERLGARGPFGRGRARVTARLLPPLVSLMRRFRPAGRAFGMRWITRTADIEAVLADPAAFEVPFGREMADLAGGIAFALGDDGALHARQRAAMDHAWRGIDAEHVRERARTVADAVLRDAGGRIDVTGELFPLVAARSAAEVLGLRVDDVPGFADAALACNALLFADPNGDPRFREEGRLGARALRPILADAVRQAMAANGEPAPGVIGRAAEWYRLNGVDREVARGDLLAIAYGLVVGYAPTTGLFAAGAVRTLATDRAAFGVARDAARRLRTENDAEARRAFDRTVLELARFHPALMPGQFRVRTARPLRSDPTRRLRGVRTGEALLVCTAAAGWDRERVVRPGRFDPDRATDAADPSADAAYSLMFGAGLHRCLGTHVALALTAECLASLLALPNVAFEDRRPRIATVGPVPGALHMRWTPVDGHAEQSQIVAAIPLRAEASALALREELKHLSADAELRAGLDATGIVHFASLNVLNLGRRGRETPHLFVELNVDGTPDEALDRIWRQVGTRLGDGLDGYLTDRPATWSDRLLGRAAAAPSPDLRTRIARHRARPSRRPWGDTGLNFVGAGEFSVRQLADEQALADLLDAFVQHEARELGTDEDDASARGADRGGADRGGVSWATRVLEEARRRAAAGGFEHLLHRARSRGPGFAREPVRTWGAFLRRYAAQALTVPVAAFLLATVAVLLLAPWGGWSLLETYVTVWWTPLLALLTAGVGLAVWLRRREGRERVDPRSAPLDHLRDLWEAEGRGGHAQTHITTVSTMKASLLRRLTFALSLHVIASFARLWFRPGFLTDFATIHYARWIRVRGTDQLVFQSNYDGSWESYLEDFITKVHGGQTLVWSNAEGFPATRWLFLDGARDGDRFKRWVRRQQIATPFWYARFPRLTLPQIHRNALIRDGLARARDVAAHRAWIKLFGSMPRKGHEFETGECQQILFRAMGRHEAGTCLPVRFRDPAGARRWLGALADEHVHGGRLDGMQGGTALRVGDTQARSTALFVALSAGGLEALGLPDDPDGAPDEGLGSFPGAFLDGMGRRAFVLGDEGTAPTWIGQGARTREDTRARAPFEAHAVLLLYTLARDDHPAQLAELIAELDRHGIESDRPIDIGRPKDEPRWLGSFGFREGVSQPVMKGTRRAARGDVADHDLVEPGEFILGYPDTRGFVPPEIVVRSDGAALRTLPFSGPPRDTPYPFFGDPRLGDLHDLGRNGSFLVIRQLQTNDAAFDRFVDRSARQLEEELDGGAVFHEQPFPAQAQFSKYGGPVRLADAQAAARFSSREWLADYVRAKLIGRWADGSSLVRHPVVSATANMRLWGHHALLRELQEDDDPSRERRRLRRELEADGAAGRLAWDDDAWNGCLAAAAAAGLSTEGLWRSDAGHDVSDNDFLFGRDDPQGVHCPIGSHIRRSNPRDTPNPHNPDQIGINNRHRLLRRGRPYRETGTDRSTGTLFMCLNANIERQFEFVQQTWLDAPHFQGLNFVPDPVVSAHGGRDRFPVPHPDGLSVLRYGEDGADRTRKAPPRFATFVGGGYFFLPSLAALRYLAQLDTPLRSHEEADTARAAPFVV